MAMMFSSESDPAAASVDKSIKSHFLIKGRNPSKLPESLTEEDFRKTVASEIKNKKQVAKRWWTKIKPGKGSSPSENTNETGENEVEAMLKSMSSSLVVTKQKITQQSKNATLWAKNDSMDEGKPMSPRITQDEAENPQPFERGILSVKGLGFKKKADTLIKSLGFDKPLAPKLLQPNKQSRYL